MRDNIKVAAGTIVGMQAGLVADVVELNTTTMGLPSRKIEVSTKDKIVNPASVELTVSKEALDERHTLRWCYKKSFNLERFHQYLLPSLAKGHLTNDGPLQRVASAKILNFCGSDTSLRQVLLTASGTAALHTLAAAWEIQKKKRLRWATQSFTFPSSIQGPMSDSIVLDIDIEHGGPCVKQMEEVKDQFDGVVVTNCFGQPNALLVYEKWCKENK